MTPTFASSSSCGSPRLVNDDHGDRVVVVVVRLDHHHHGVVDTASRSRRVAVQVPSSLNVVPTTCIYICIYIYSRVSITRQFAPVSTERNDRSSSTCHTLGVAHFYFCGLRWLAHSFRRPPTRACIARRSRTGTQHDVRLPDVLT